jgi:flagellar biosynthetic protein FliR
MAPFIKSLGFDFDLFPELIVWGLIFVRIFVMLLIVPFMGSKALPGRARMALALVLSFFLYPLIGAPLKGSLPEGANVILALYFKEAFFGFTVGFVTLAIFHALEAAGNVVDNQRGGANAQLFVPALGQVSLFGLFNFWLGIAFFLSIGGHRLFFEAFFNSYLSVPLLKLPNLAPGFSPFLEFIVRLSGDVLLIAIQLSAPVLIAVFLVDTVLGLANKMAPQINVFELGFGIKGYVAPLMIYVTMLVFVSQIHVILNTMIDSVKRVGILFGQ